MTAMTGVDSIYDDLPEDEPPWRPKPSQPSGQPRPPGQRRRSDGPDRRLYRNLRAMFRTQCMARREPCWLCGEPIEYDRVYPDPMAWELDHAEPVALAPQLELEPSNWRASHSCHNRARATSAVVSEYGESSEAW